MKRAMLIYGPFTYVMEVSEFRDEIRVMEPMTLPLLKDYIKDYEDLPSEVPYKRLVFQPKGFTSKDTMEYVFVRRI